jgi:hypothetical protein
MARSTGDRREPANKKKNGFTTEDTESTEKKSGKDEKVSVLHPLSLRHAVLEI